MKRKLNLVLGSNYGDEGKGQTCYNLARPFKSCLSILTNGGCQRGHTVINDNNIRHVFQHFGSPTRSDLDYNYFSKKFILNPIMFKIEYEALVSKNIISSEMTVLPTNSNILYEPEIQANCNTIILGKSYLF
jgi:adenylosuccinate synthase